MKNWFKHIFLFLIALGIAGAVGVLSGLLPVNASSGHWPVTAWFLNFAMERSTSTYSLFVKDAPEFNRQMVLQGAGHYELECRTCHGGPEEKGFIGQHTTPKAPFLPHEIGNWSDEELFRIVKHGVKFTGMPAWPDLKRDDEVWAMVAFLRKLPELDKESYAQLVSEKSATNFKTCANCHGPDGNGREGAFPKLAGQNSGYLEHALQSYKNGKRHSGTMELVASKLSEDMIREIARFYGGKKRTPEKVSGHAIDDLQLGKRIAHEGIPEKKVAACVRCHGPGDDGRPLKPHFPDLRGQPAAYLSNQLRLFFENKRGGSEHAKLMKKAVPSLGKKERDAVSAYYESLLNF